MKYKIGDRVRIASYVTFDDPVENMLDSLKDYRIITIKGVTEKPYHPNIGVYTFKELNVVLEEEFLQTPKNPISTHIPILTRFEILDL